MWRPAHSPNCLFFTADDNQNTIQWDYSHSSNISNATHFLPLHLLPLLTPPQGAGWPRLLSKIRKLPHFARFSPTNRSPCVRPGGNDEDDERIFCILHIQSPCCIFILVWEAHYENIIYAVAGTIPVLDSVFVCFIHLQSAELMSLNLTSWMSTFSVTFSAVLSSQCYGYQNWLLSVQAVECYIECDVLPAEGGDTQCGTDVTWHLLTPSTPPTRCFKH